MHIRWQTLGLDQEYRLFRDKLIVGLLKKDILSNNAYGEYHGYLLRFQAPNWERPQARILDIEGKKVLGTIAFGYFPRRATITYEGETYVWKYLSWGRWTVTQDEETATYKAGRGWTQGGTGTITYDYLPSAVVLAGLYIRSYFRQRFWLLGIAFGTGVGLSLLI